MGLFSLAMTLTLAAGPAQTSQPQTAAKPPRQRVFEMMDKDANRSLSVEEFLAGSIGAAADNHRSEFKKWDLDDSGGLSLEEFRKRGNTDPPAEPNWDREFRRRDRDLDRNLSLEEFLGDQKGEVRRSGRINFHQFDGDADGRLTPEEFTARGKGVRAGARQLFSARDFDDSGRLSLDEFLFGRKSAESRADGEAMFRLFDYDGDRGLTFDEFSLLPMAGPDLYTKFRGRDKDGDGRLSPRELALFTASAREGQWVQRSFAQFDADGDGYLSLDEMTARSERLTVAGRAARESDEWSWSAGSLMLLALGGTLYAAALYVAFRLGRGRAAGRSTLSVRAVPREPAVPAPSSKLPPGAPAAPGSIDEFRIV